MGKKIRAQRLYGSTFCPYIVKNGRVQLTSFNDLKTLLKGNVVNIGSIAKSGNDMGLSDAFAWLDRKYQITLAALEQLNEASDRKTIVITTQSDLIGCDDYVDRLAELSTRHDVEIQIVYPKGLDADDFRTLLPACPSQLRLDKAIEKLTDAGLNVVRLNLSGRKI